jgi:hypothetical protein
VRSTRATAAVARLNRRSTERHFLLVMTGSGLFLLRERVNGGDRDLSAALPLDDFVRFVDAQGPQPAPRITRNDAAFARQLVRKPEPAKQTQAPQRDRNTGPARQAGSSDVDTDTPDADDKISDDLA